MYMVRLLLSLSLNKYVYIYMAYLNICLYIIIYIYIHKVYLPTFWLLHIPLTNRGGLGTRLGRESGEELLCAGNLRGWHMVVSQNSILGYPYFRKPPYVSWFSMENCFKFDSDRRGTPD